MHAWYTQYLISNAKSYKDETKLIFDTISTLHSREQYLFEKTTAYWEMGKLASYNTRGSVEDQVIRCSMSMN